MSFKGHSILTVSSYSTYTHQIFLDPLYHDYFAMDIKGGSDELCVWDSILGQPALMSKSFVLSAPVDDSSIDELDRIQTKEGMGEERGGQRMKKKKVSCLLEEFEKDLLPVSLASIPCLGLCIKNHS